MALRTSPRPPTRAIIRPLMSRPPPSQRRLCGRWSRSAARLGGRTRLGSPSTLRSPSATSATSGARGF
jgi:hypothetical protein